jgi:electron transfer flavoprotein beta subunit
MNIVIIVRPAPGWEKPRFNLETGAPEIPPGTAVGLSAWGEGTWVLNQTDRDAIDVALDLRDGVEEHKQTMQGEREQVFGVELLKEAVANNPTSLEWNLTTVAIATGEPAAATDILYEALARGANRAILIDDPELGSDATVSATAIAAAVRALAVEQEIDLVLMGAQAPDGSPDVVAPMVAAALGWSQMTGAEQLFHNLIEGGRLQAQQLWDGAWRTLAVRLPAVISVVRQWHWAPARYTLGAGIMAAYRQRKVEVWDQARLGLDTAAPEQLTPGVTIRRNALADAAAGERLAGPVEESVAVLLQGLKGQGLI